MTILITLYNTFFIINILPLVLDIFEIDIRFHISAHRPDLENIFDLEHKKPTKRLDEVMTYNYVKEVNTI